MGKDTTMLRLQPRPAAQHQPLPQLIRLGQVVMTAGVSAWANARTMSDNPASGFPYLAECLDRHKAGDWGEVAPEDWEKNDAAMGRRLRVISAYPLDPEKPCKGFGPNCLWVITEADRSATTLLLPEEY